MIVGRSTVHIRPCGMRARCNGRPIWLVGWELAAGGWPGEGIPQIDQEGVLQAPEDADLPQHALRLLWAAQHIWDPFERHLHALPGFRALL